MGTGKMMRWAVLGGLAVGLLAVANLPAAPADDIGGVQLAAGSATTGPTDKQAVTAAPTTTVVQAVAGPSSEARQTAVATCPAGTRILSGGGRVIGGRGIVLLYDLRPSGNGTAGNPDRFSVSAAKRRPAQSSGGSGGGIGGNFGWSVEAYAVCGPLLPGYLRVQSAVEDTIVNRLTATVKCPGSTRYDAVRDRQQRLK
jgi:hypothetical protein